MSETKKYWHNVLSVFGGAATAQIIPIVGALAIARLYGPEQFGIFSVWLSSVLLIAAILTVRLEMSFAQERDGRPRDTAVLVTLVVLIACFLLFLLIGGLAFKIGLLKKLEGSLALYALSIPAAALFSANQVWQMWAAADGNYTNLNYFRISQAISITVLQIVLGIVYPVTLTLAFAYCIGLLITQLYCMKKMNIRIFYGKNFRRIVFLFLKRHHKFPLFSLPADFINVLASQLPVIITTARFGAESAGFLAMSIRVLGAPLAFLGKAVLDVFRRQAAIALRERGECRKEYLQTFKVLAIGAIVFTVIMFYCSTPIFKIAFGDEWAQAGVISVLLLPMFSMRFVSSPLSYVIYLVNKQHVDLVWQIFLVALTYITLSYSSNENQAFLYYSVSYAFLYVVYLFMSYHYSMPSNRLKGS